MDMFNPPHPGQVLRDYLPEGMPVTEAAKRLGVSRVALSRVLNQRTALQKLLPLANPAPSAQIQGREAKPHTA